MYSMIDKSEDKLGLIARDLRLSIVKTSSKKRIPHLGSCLSCLDVLVYLYWREMRCDPDDCPNNDIFILSKGHAAPALLQVLAHKGFFNRKELDRFGRDGDYFHEHPPKPGLVKGIEAATGSLGHGLPMAIGMALAKKIQNSAVRTYVIVGDGECNEGVIWEAAMFASSQEIGSLTVFVDSNKWQATGRTKEIMEKNSMAKRWEAFGWHTQEIDGHCFGDIEGALNNARGVQDKPSVIIANTTKGKGISFMEDDNNWHYRTPSAEELLQAVHELEAEL